MIKRTVQIICDAPGCDVSITDSTYGRRNISSTSIQAKARAEGWRISVDGHLATGRKSYTHRCPDHASTHSPEVPNG